MSGRKYLIVNADDFGLSDGVNEGIIDAHEQGIVTSTTLMVRGAAVNNAIALSRTHPRLAVGLHIDLGEWMFEQGTWNALYEVVALDSAATIKKEIENQFDTFCRLAGKNPTHLDSHQHVHLREPIISVARELSTVWSIPLRACVPYIRYCGDFYGQTNEGAPLPAILTIEHLLKILASLKDGCTELSCHPGNADDLRTMYRAERRKETEVLCDLRVQQALRESGIQLCSFNDIKHLAMEKLSSA